MTLTEAKTLQSGDTIFCTTQLNADGTNQKFVLQANPKLWKTRPKEIQLSLKGDLKQYYKINQDELKYFSTN